MGYYEINIDCTTDIKEALVGILNCSGMLGMVENTASLTCYFSDNKGIEAVLDTLNDARERLIKAGLADDLYFHYLYLSERDWNETWKKRLVPIDVGEHITILPPWETKKQGRINIIIDPGMAFGTGHHETTQDCVELIRIFGPMTTRETFLDLGTGTGILAIAASIMGFSKITAIDMDELAVDASKRNAAENNLSNIDVLHGDVSEAKGSYDMVAANLLLNVLKKNIALIASLTANQGIVLLSGLIEGQQDQLIPDLLDNGLRLIMFTHSNNWVSLVMKKD